MYEWKSEPSKMYFNHNGYECSVIRNESYGYLCGYVKVPESHPLFRKGQYEVEDLDLEVHGGISFWRILKGEHWIGFEGEHWIGFDAFHSFDLVPNDPQSYDNEYRNMDYMMNECRSLVHQLMTLV